PPAPPPRRIRLGGADDEGFGLPLRHPPGRHRLERHRPALSPPRSGVPGPVSRIAPPTHPEARLPGYDHCSMNHALSPARRRPHPAKGITALIFGILYAAFLLLHDLLPTRMGIALIVESLLPWTGIFLALVLLMTLIRFSWLSVIGLVIPALVWTGMFGPALLPNQSAGDADLKVATHNVGARMPQPTAAAQNLVDQDPDIVTIQ